jgi:peroxiredoxin
MEYKLEFVAATGAKGLELGDAIPEVSGKDLDNIKFKLSDYRGKVVMLDFWGDW